MIPDTITATRVDDIRRYVEFDALSNLVCLLVKNFSNDWSDDEVLRQIGWDTLVVDDGLIDRDIFSLRGRLWPEDDAEPNYEENPDWRLAHAESRALMARMFTLLASDHARAEFVRLGAHSAKLAEEYAQRARETMSPAG
jgi:hypothetical protein